MEKPVRMIAAILSLARKNSGEDVEAQRDWLAYCVLEYQKHVSKGLIRAGKAEQPNSTKES
jgi:hypothetical protein